jgi:N-acetylmuramoyl-L-alanine amidase
MLRFLLIFSLLFTFIIPFPAQTWGVDAEDDPDSPQVSELEKTYQQAKSYYNELHTNTSLGNSRTNWLNGIRNFRKIYLAGPKSDFAAPSLYMLARMYAKMYKRFGSQLDLQESISYYRDVSDLFPDNRLADDALYAVANIFLTEENNPEKAAKYFVRIIEDHRNGDIYPLASDKLKSLSKEQGIPLPEAMLKHSYLGNLSYVLPVKYWSSNNYTRVVINASGPVTYSEKLLEKHGDLPRRLYIDFKQSYIEPRYRAPVPIEDGLLRQIRTGQFTPETVRVVLDIESISNYKIFSLPDPFRVVIDVRGETKVAEEPSKISPQAPAQISSNSTTPAVVTQPAPEPTMIVLDDHKKTEVSGKEDHSTPELNDGMKAIKISLAQQLGLGVRKIVVDPGHGGKDPGASAFGLKEKDIVLNICKKLAPALAEQTGAEVILTRDTDTYIALEERTAIANTQAADLFISLHINAHSSPKVHGLETYYLNLSTNAEAMRVAAFENATSTYQMSDLQDILSDIMKNSKINESSRLAGYVHNSLSDGIKEVQETKFKDLGVKQAPFYVLIGAEMPAILIEIAFITNPDESMHLSQDIFLEGIVKDIAAGVECYIHSTTASL